MGEGTDELGGRSRGLVTERAWREPAAVRVSLAWVPAQSPPPHPEPAVAVPSIREQDLMSDTSFLVFVLSPQLSEAERGGWMGTESK